MTAHSPTPWRFGRPKSVCLKDHNHYSTVGMHDCEFTFQGWLEDDMYLSSEPDQRVVIEFDSGPGHNQADAEFILRAVNCHDELVEALKRLSSTWGCFAGCLAALSKLGECSDHNYSCKVARAALAKAEAK